METLATLVAGGGNDKDIIAGTIPDSVGEQWMGRAGGRKFAPADVDIMSACLNSLRDGSGEIELGTGNDRTIGPIPENRHDQAATTRRDPFDWSVVLAEDHTSDVGAVL